jgi:hypothetical protein
MWKKKEFTIDANERTDNKIERGAKRERQSFLTPIKLFKNNVVSFWVAVELNILFCDYKNLAQVCHHYVCSFILEKQNVNVIIYSHDEIQEFRDSNQAEQE